MARRRNITSDMSADDRLAELGEKAGTLALLLYTWMIPHAEDDATIHGTPRQIKLKVIPGVDCTVQDVETALQAMCELGLIEWDREHEVIGFPPEAFYRYQTYIPPARRRTQPLAEYLRSSDRSSADQRNSPQSAAGERTSAQNAASPSLSPSLSLTEKTSANADGAEGAPGRADCSSGETHDAPTDSQPEEPKRKVRHYSSEAKAVADRLKADLEQRGAVLPRDWHLRAYAVAQRMLDAGITAREIDEAREAAWSDPWWSQRLDSMATLQKLVNQRRLGKAGPQARDKPRRAWQQIPETPERAAQEAGAIKRRVIRV